MLHEKFLYISKYYGLIYLVIFTVCIVAYALWPRNKKKFDRAAKSIIDDPEDKPKNEK